MERRFLLFITVITLLGVGLRTFHFDTFPPVNETFDEVHYAWGGLTWITQGVPKSWSNLEAYTNTENIEFVGTNLRLVWPLLEKPPFYFLLSGVSLRLLGIKTISETNHTAIRILPLTLSFLTIIFVGILGKLVLSEKVGLLAAFLYATVPTVVFANRLSLTENLLTPFSLLAFIIILIQNKSHNFLKIQPLILGIIASLSFLTKQIGISVGTTLFIILWLNHKPKPALFIAAGTLLGIFIYLLFGYAYDWNLFLRLQHDVRIAHTLSGLPEMMTNLFRYPGYGQKDRLFLDGSMLLGYLLLFAAPLWLRIKLKSKHNTSQKSSSYKTAAKSIQRFQNLSKLDTFLIFPFVYLIFLTVGQSGSAPFTYFGWYVFPLFPFMMLLLAKYFSDLWKDPAILPLMLSILIIGSSSIRFFFLWVPREYQHRWQYVMIILLGLTLFAWWKPGIRLKRLLILGLFTIFELINIYTVLHMSLLNGTSNSV